MEPRDVFDGVLLVLVTAVTYWELFGFALTREQLERIISAILGIDLTVYLVGAGIIGIIFVSYIAVYVPRKYGNRAGDPPE
jgi:hypothetical protein